MNRDIERMEIFIGATNTPITPASAVARLLSHSLLDIRRHAFTTPPPNDLHDDFGDNATMFTRYFVLSVYVLRRWFAIAC